MGGASLASNLTKHPPVCFSCVILSEQMSELAEFIQVVVPPVSMKSFIFLLRGADFCAAAWKLEMGAGRACRVVDNSERTGEAAAAPSPSVGETACHMRCIVLGCQKVLDDDDGLEGDDQRRFGTGG